MLSKSLNSIKTSLELIDKHSEAKAFGKLNTEISTLNKAYYELQIEVIQLVEEKEILKTKLLEYEKWDQIIEQYALHELATGVFAYVPKPGIESEEPRHYLCANCFHKKEKSILQRSGLDGRGVRYKCSGCGAEILDHSDKRPYSSVRR